MKVKVTQDAKKWLTVAEMPEVRRIIEYLKDYDWTESDKQTIARLGMGDEYETFEILKAEAEIAGNCRVWNYYTDDSGRLDVWLVVYGYNQFTGFVEAQMYLSDLWSLSADNRDEIRSHMYVNKFTKNERR